MSKLLIPKHAMQSMAAAQAISRSSVHRMDSDDFITPKEVQRQIDALNDYILLRRTEEPDYQLPQPSGWRLTVLVLTIPEKSDGGVIVIDDAKEARSLASPQGVLLSMGPQAYKDPNRFSEPWHKIGDRIQFVKYDATMFQLANGQRLGTLNDTQPVATIDRGWGVPQ